MGALSAALVPPLKPGKIADLDGFNTQAQLLAPILPEPGTERPSAAASLSAGSADKQPSTDSVSGGSAGAPGGGTANARAPAAAAAAARRRQARLRQHLHL